ncbi:GGDEF domain-containing protein [Paenibacillus albus]|uniref:GGDEF domain-containing protein n=1 Tax=Paenibacillus albus TaxID=2495582 RepID=A0A3Q8X2Y1_9BACL|nr:GGDEF domain-containing protein [Paenibacillus albus]AZN39247.1 GGDEF domain-containing protein [Paenibacillus albus]
MYNSVIPYDDGELCRIMKNASQKSDHVLEAIFSVLHWIFLLTAVWIYFGYYQSPQTQSSFVLLLCGCTAYMALIQVILFKGNLESKTFYIVTRLGVILDVVAVTLLLTLTGDACSPMFPIYYFIILHAAVYWGLRGGILSSVLLAACYSAVLLGSSAASMHDHAADIGMNFICLLLMGVGGGIVVARGRKHLGEKSRFEQMAKHDYLTGLSNRRRFQGKLKELVHSGGKLALVMGDIDWFKSVNDRYGHLVGDQVLREVAAMLYRTFNAEHGGKAYRYGGEEFAITMRTDSHEEVHKRLAMFQEELSKLTFTAEEGQSFQVTMSFGFTFFDNHTVADLIKEADESLYEAKRQGRNCVVCLTCDV